MQIEPTQQATMLKMRQELVRNLALTSRRRQQLLYQLQNTPQALGVNSHEFGSHLSAVDALTEQLQQCVTQEDELFYDYLTTISLAVGHFSICSKGTCFAHAYLQNMHILVLLLPC